MLYDNWSLYNRSIKLIPATLALEEVDCAGSISEYELGLISKPCPKMKNLGLEYKPIFNREMNSESDLPDLALLSKLAMLDQLRVTFADFYSHSLSSAMRTIGGRLTHLELNNVDELNLGSLILVGEHCLLMTRLVICNCHYTPETSDMSRIELACTQKVGAGQND